MSGKVEKRGLVPRLRFPEFRDAGEWYNKRLEEVAPFQRGFDLPSDQIRPGKIPVVYSNGIQNYHDIGMAKGPGLVTGRSGTIGKIHFIEEGDYWPHNTSLWITSFHENHPKFIYYLYSSIGMGRFASGSGVPTLNRNDVHTFKACVPPSIDEQQKIADCLTSLDELITLEAQKLDTLKTHKKGLMQQLFPAEGETVPQLRFPEFLDAGEWMPKSIGSVCKTYSGGTPDTTRVEFYDGDIPFIRSAEIDKNDTELFLTQEGLSNSAAKLVAKGDVLVALYGANSGDVALAKIDGAINQAILCLKSENSNAFIYQYLAHIKNWIVSTYIQGGQGNLSAEIVKSIKLCFPTPEEQQKIASCLTSLDDLITAQTQQLAALKTHKKGLMQQLFPVLDEV